MCDWLVVFWDGSSQLVRNADLIGVGECLALQRIDRDIKAVVCLGDGN